MADSRMMSRGSAVSEQKCPACGGPMIFDPVSGKMLCEYCGTSVDIEAAGPQNAAGTAQQASPAAGAAAAAAGTASAAAGTDSAAAGAGEDEYGEDQTTVGGFDFQSLTDQVTDENAEDLPVYNCKSCGAEIIAPPSQVALTCPYCGNNIVLTDKVTGKLRPDGVIPFRITAKELPAAMQKFYQGKVLLPKRFFSDSTMGHVTGVYVPFWVFSGKVEGTLDFVGSKSKSHQEGDYEVTETRRFSMSRNISIPFENLPVDASGRVDDALMDSMEPFNMKEAKPFDMRYLAGFTADRFDVAKNDIESRAKKRMLTTAAGIAASNVAGYYGVRRTGGDVKLNLNAKYLLFPIYLFDIKHDKKKYSFAVNGQTGKVVGEIPTDKTVSRNYFLVRAAAVVGGVMLLAVIKYLLGA